MRGRDTATGDPFGRDVRSWVDASRYDLETARALLKTRRYLHVLFMCQQALEKILKAHATVRTARFPPRIHDLVRLGELADTVLSTEERELLERLSLYYLQTRYPPELKALAKRVDRSMAAGHLERTEALWQRLRRQLARRR